MNKFLLLGDACSGLKCYADADGVAIANSTINSAVVVGCCCAVWVDYRVVVLTAESANHIKPCTKTNALYGWYGEK